MSGPEATAADAADADADASATVRADAPAPAASSPAPAPAVVPHKPWAWHAVRVSGLFLAALVVWHALVTFVLQDVGQTTAVTMANHWRDTTWRALEWITVVLALAHGGLGLDHLLREVPWRSSVRVAARVASGVCLAGLAVAASAAVLTYR